MLEGLVGLMAELAFVIGEASEVNGMLESSRARVSFWRTRGIVNHRVADVAIISDHFPRIADMFTVMTTETTRGIKMTDIVRMSLPIRFHLREKVRLKDALNFFDARSNRFILARIHVAVIGSVELIQAGRNRCQSFVS